MLKYFPSDYYINSLIPQLLLLINCSKLPSEKVEINGSDVIC